MNDIHVPDYLQRTGLANHYYGTLTFEVDTHSWVIKGEPIVCQTAKKLFPRCEGKGRRMARFYSNKRIIGDLNWLMLRYPLKIKDEKRWQKALEEAIHHVLERERIAKYPLKAVPDQAYFKGELKEFQKEGLGHLLQNRRTLLADEMGLGKTVQALAFLADTKTFPCILVVPPHLVTNWCQEIERFLNIPQEDQNIGLETNEKPRIHIIRGLKPYPLPEAQIYIIHYLLLRGWKKVLPDLGFKAVLFDEIQELRHAETEKYSAASLLSESCENVLGLSGTPIYNRGGEIWNVINIIEYHCMGDWESFTREWCSGFRSITVTAPKMLGDHLRREGLLLRRTKEHVLAELPPKRRVVHFVDADDKLYGSLMKSAIEKANVLDQVQDVLEKGRIMREIVNEERQATGISKASYVVSFVKMLLDGGEKVLLFAYHHAVMDIYAKELKEYDIVFVTGRENEKKKVSAVKSFMEGKTNICCLSLRAAAGLNLQRASCVVFGELDWSPAVHSQAEDRAHRLGQLDSVLCYYLVCSMGSDQDIQDALGLKVSQFNGLMGGRTETEEERMLAQSVASEHMKKIVERIKGTTVMVEGRNETVACGELNKKK